MTLFEQALDAQKTNNFKEAERLYRQIIAIDPRNFDALHMLGIACAENGKMAEAESYFLTALAIDPNYPPIFHNYGLFLSKNKRYKEAIEQFDQALKLFPKFAPVYCDRGIAQMEIKLLDESLASHDTAVTLAPNIPITYYNRATTLFRREDFNLALRDYDKAIALDPKYSDAYCGRGNVFYKLKQYDAALSAYDKALALKPDLENAWLGRGNVFYDLKRNDESFAAYDKALALKPDLAEAWLGRGNVFCDLKRDDESFAAYDKALALKPDLAEAWLGRGGAFVNLKRYDEAFAEYDKAFAIKPDMPGVEGLRLITKMQVCDWSNFDAECARLISSVGNQKANTPPFAFLAISSSVEDQLQCAKLWVSQKCPPHEGPIWHGQRYAHDRIRLGYVSADFGEHVVPTLLAGVFECHDKSRFDITAISFGPDDTSEMRRRLQAAFGRNFIDVKAWSDKRIADLIKEAEIDILVDLMGHTRNSRPNILARRPAPIQVSYLGYLGTMGAEYIDYIIADKIVIPEAQRCCYAEKIVELPNGFQPTDRERRISDKKFRRAEVGLPQQGFVFCCFNSSYKLTPDVFDIWMRLLKQVDGSVLWLAANSPAMMRNLRNEAGRRSVDPERLIFAPIVPLPEHQARLCLADLFLDTLPYNAGATASDTLWAGLPVLTRLGAGFVGRMAASVLNAIDLSELITTTSEAYEALAIDLAVSPRKLDAIKQKLARNRRTTPLFDTKLYTQHLEAAYTAMHERHQAGLIAEHIVIPNC